MPDALKSFDLDALPASVRRVILALAEDNACLSTRNTELEAANARLEHLVKELNQLIYGKRSEKLTADERQLAFEDLEIAVAEVQAQCDAVSTAAPSKQRAPAQRNLGNLPEHLERIEQIIEPDSIVCPLSLIALQSTAGQRLWMRRDGAYSLGCGEMVRIHCPAGDYLQSPRGGEDRTERLDIIPAQARVIVTIRPKYACPKKQGGVVQAAAPVHLIEGGLPTEGAMAYVGVAKYADHCPLFRQSQIYARSGLNLDRSTLAGWMGKMSFHLAPVVDHMLKELKSSRKLFAPSRQIAVQSPAG